MIKCIIFDFDGVIANTDKARFMLLKNILIDYNINLEDRYFYKIIGYSTSTFLQKYFTKLDENDLKKIIKKRHEMYFSNLPEYCIPFKNAITTIKKYSKENKLAIVTTNSRNNVIKQLDFLGLTNCFDWIIGREITVTKYLAKDYSKISEIINISPQNCIVVEDSELGINAAKKAGYYCIQFNPYEEKSEFQVGNVSANNYNDIVTVIDAIKTANIVN